MKNLLAIFIAFAILTNVVVYAESAGTITIDFYYGVGCPHCAATEKLFEKLGQEYKLNITKYEVYRNSTNREKMIEEYQKFNVSINEGGVPTTIVNGKAFVIGELSEEQWRELFSACINETCPSGVLTQKKFDLMQENGKLTWTVLIGAALVDSINPCTLAIMVILISAILYSKGKKDALVSGLLFSLTTFIMYLLYGLFIKEAVSYFNIADVFYIIVTIGALALAIMEFNAYLNYKPGFLAVEMPLFLRPYAHAVLEKATSPLGVVIAALFCSLFLLPCSSGPYLMVLGMLAKSITPEALTYLIIYNMVFILPMIAVTFVVYLGKTTIERVGEMKEKYIREIHLASGIILFLLFLIMLNEIVKFV